MTTKVAVLQVVLESAIKDNDFYNGARALIRQARKLNACGEKLNDADLTRLVCVYPFVFNERMSSLFEACHDVLWRAFEIAGDTGNLFKLFRQSSLIWRLRQDRIC